ncbi:MAG: hypothetical protein GF383_06755, partial [Candidatus Lokiarchaeota archaeon]|nr:hypothetical protein [Candidatus Lokiarchaeota archaeon]MBD3339817.1 hypothetical protein [Candidatus Lokiarchaeota archaeon]
MDNNLTALERINIVLEGGVPDRVPSICLGPDFEFLNHFMHSPYALTQEDLEHFAKDSLVPHFLHTQHLLAKFSPQEIYDGGLNAKIDLCWEVLYGIPLKKGEESDTLVTENGQIFKFVVNDEGIPAYWYIGPSLTTKEKIKKFWETQKDLRPDKARFKILSKNRKKMKKYDIVVAQGFNGPFETCVLG